jgi:hypothetical protein
MNETSLERKIVAAALKNRESFVRIVGASDVDTAFTPYAGLLLKLAGNFYERDSLATQVDREVLEGWIEAKTTAKNQELYKMYLAEAMSMDVSAINVADLVVETKRKNIGAKLAAILLDENADQARIGELLTQYEELDLLSGDEEEEDINEVSIEDMLTKAQDSVGTIKLLPKALDDAVKGRTKRGHHIVVFARPEVGKTATVITLICGFAWQGLRVIHFGNEEPTEDTRLRTLCCLTGWTEEQCIADPKGAVDLAEKRGWRNIRFIPLSPGTPREIDEYVRKYAPDVIICDQIRNLNVGAETRVNQLEMAATAMRNIGKRRNVLSISVTQAGDSADGKLVLDMGDVDFSNTGIPATADLMIGVGMNKQYESDGLRCYSLCKNKIGAIHIFFPVRFRPEISRMENT